MKPDFDRFFEYIDGIVDRVSNPIYFWLIFASYVVYIAAFLGILYINTKYIHELSVFIQVFIATVLIIRFNPLRKHVLRESDITIIFASAVFLLINVGLTETVASYVKSVWSHKMEPKLDYFAKQYE